jgi:hypothetical protein
MGATFFEDEALDSSHSAESLCNICRKAVRFSLTWSVFHSSL